MPAPLTARTVARHLLESASTAAGLPSQHDDPQRPFITGFPGTCVVTGARYPIGTEIARAPGGFAVVTKTTAVQQATAFLAVWNAADVRSNPLINLAFDSLSPEAQTLVLTEQALAP